MTFEGMCAEFARAIRVHGRCACQMKGGTHWYCMAQTEVAKQCGLCRAVAQYEAMLIRTVAPEVGEPLEHV